MRSSPPSARSRQWQSPGCRSRPWWFPVLVAAVLLIAIVPRFTGEGGTTPAATPVRIADLVMQDHDDGSVSVFRAQDHALVTTLPPATNAFVRVVLSGLVRERRREDMGSPAIPFRLTRWSDGRLTLDDAATHKLIELNAFGPDNAGAFERLLDLTRPAPRT